MARRRSSSRCTKTPQRNTSAMRSAQSLRCGPHILSDASWRLVRVEEASGGKRLDQVSSEKGRFAEFRVLVGGGLAGGGLGGDLGHLVNPDPAYPRIPRSRGCSRGARGARTGCSACSQRAHVHVHVMHVSTHAPACSLCYQTCSLCLLPHVSTLKMCP